MADDQKVRWWEKVAAKVPVSGEPQPGPSAESVNPITEEELRELSYKLNNKSPYEFDMAKLCKFTGLDPYRIRLLQDKFYNLKKSNDRSVINRSFPEFLRDGRHKNHVPLLEPAPLAELDAKERLALENIDRRTLAAHVVQLEETDPDFVAELKAARAARRAFSEAAEPSMPLPTVAPELGADRSPNAEAADYRIAADTPFWKDRDTTDPRNPVEFIKDHYGKMKRDGTWDNAGLTRPQLKRDAQLYAAYATWISRHPNDALTFAPGRNAGRYERIDNPQEFMERRRASEAQSRSKAKAGRRGDTPKPD